MLHRGAKKNLDVRPCWVSPSSLLVLGVKLVLHKNPKGQGAECFPIAEHMEVCGQSPLTCGPMYLFIWCFLSSVGQWSKLLSLRKGCGNPSL
jgi:hypothetical protein